MRVNDSLTRSTLERRVVTLIQETLPGNWKISEPILSPATSRFSDFRLNASAPDGQLAMLNVELKQVIDRRDVPQLVDQIRYSNEDAVPIVGARYLSKSVRDSLTTEGIEWCHIPSPRVSTA